MSIGVSKSEALFVFHSGAGIRVLVRSRGLGDVYIRQLMPGDLIFTGTPAGVGPINKGETMEGGIEGVGTIKIAVV